MEYSRKFQTRQTFKMRDHIAALKGGRKIRIDERGASSLTDWVEIELTGPMELRKEIDRCAFLFENFA